MADNFWEQDKPADAQPRADEGGGSQWWKADRPAAKQELPAGVTPSNAGAGRGSMVREPPQEPVFDASGEGYASLPTPTRRQSVLEGVQLPPPTVTPENEQENGRLSNRRYAERSPTVDDPRNFAPSMTETPKPPRRPAPAPSSGSVAKDLAINAFAGGAKTAVGAAGALADAVGARDTAASMDEIRHNWEGVQKENGGDTISGKAADLVGAVAPALLVPASKAAQLVSNAGLFAIPAFRDTLKSQLDQGRSFPLALAHAAENFGINLFLPAVATRGSAVVSRALGADGATGLRAAGTAAAQAAGEGAAFSAVNSVADKGTDLLAGQANDRDWLDLQDMAANALGFSALRAGHSARTAAGAVADRVGSKSQQFGRAFGQDVDATELQTPSDVQLNPNLRGQPATETPTTQASAPAPAAPAEPAPDSGKPDAGDQLLNILSVTDPERIKQLRAAGEGAVADELQRRADQQAADTEVQRMADQPFAGPAFEHFYRRLRADGLKPAEAGARAGMLGTFAQMGSQAGISAQAVHAATEKALNMPLGNVPQFLDRYAAALARRGIGKGFGEGALADATSTAGDRAMSTALAAYAPAEKPSKLQEKPEVAATATEQAPAPAFDTGNDVAVTPEAAAAHQAATSPLSDLPEPTQAQKDAGNYKVGRLRVAGMDISVENPQGSVRRGVGADGKPWETPLKDHYGYIRGTVGADKDHLDVFVKPGTPEDYRGPVFVVDQIDPHTGKFDEAKVVLGAADHAEAEAVYRRNYSADWKGLGAITQLPMGAFKAWARSDHTKEPLGDLSHITPAAEPDREQAARPAEATPPHEGAAPARATQRDVAADGSQDRADAVRAGGAPAADVEKPKAQTRAEVTKPAEEVENSSQKAATASEKAGAKSDESEQPARGHAELKRQVIDLRKRSAVLRALRECLNG